MSRPTTVLDALIAARAHIEREENWGQGARGIGLPIRGTCAAGAIVLTCPELLNATLNVLSSAINFSYIPYWNDTHSHAEVIAGFDAAIVRARREAQVTELLSAASVPAERGELVSA